MTRVLVVDDSKFMRTVVRNTLEDFGYTVKEAPNGEAAASAVQKYDPDIVTMDVEMPKMDGLEATEKIMNVHPVPILMLSAYTPAGADTTLNALEAGAVDVVRKPNGEETPIDRDGFEEQLVDAVQAVASTSVGQDTEAENEDEQLSITSRIPDEDSPVIVIGASTGGPSIVEEILRDIPIELNARILIVQHMPPQFTGRFAERVNDASEYTVREATDGMTLSPSEGVVAPGSSDLVVKEGCEGIEMSIRPGSRNGTSSINETLRTVSESTDNKIISVLLTGMGDDGAQGTEYVKRANGHVIAQNEETSPVFGIPRKAIQTGNVDEVLSDNEIVRAIINVVN